MLRLDQEGKVAVGTRAVLGRTGIGVGVRKGMPKPDITTAEAFKRALFNAENNCLFEGRQQRPLFSCFT